jgi:hypothetical protein
MSELNLFHKRTKEKANLVTIRDYGPIKISVGKTDAKKGDQSVNNRCSMC